VSLVTRTEHYYDPDAPRANSIVVAITAVVRNEAGDILLQRRTDNNLWALPGGAQDIGESIAETVVREVLEETGIEVEVAGLVGIYTNPHHVVEFSDGEVRQQFSICFHARPVGGELATSRRARVRGAEPGSRLGDRRRAPGPTAPGRRAGARSSGRLNLSRVHRRSQVWRRHHHRPALVRFALSP
jgi:ADP-ribose pyrophosphatase YjhB (NUDIX family)